MRAYIEYSEPENYYVEKHDLINKNRKPTIEIEILDTPYTIHIPTRPLPWKIEYQDEHSEKIEFIPYESELN